MSATDTNISDLARWTGTWVLDTAKTTVALRTQAMWVVPVKGHANAARGDAQINSGGGVRGTFVIDAASFTTKNKKRDGHLRSEAILNVARYPTIVFTANGARLVGSGRFEITGILTIRDQSQPLKLQAEVSGSRRSIVVATEVEIDRRLWGVTWPGEAWFGAGVKNHVAIRAHFNRT